MKLLAVVPARGGSKRLQRKNVLPLGGKPLIVWTIEVAKQVSSVCEVLVSTDDEEIARIAKEVGGLVPWLRPAEFATDEATSVDVVLHALGWYEEGFGCVDGVLLLQPTSPFRSGTMLQEGISLFTKGGGASVIGVSKVHTHPAWMFREEGGRLVPYLGSGGSFLRSQELEPVYAVNGTFYLVAPQTLRANQSFFGGELIPLVIESEREALDIDTELDYQVAMRLCGNFNRLRL